MEKNKTYYGYYQSNIDKIRYTTPSYNYLASGDWKTGFRGVERNGGEDIYYDIINKELIDESKFNGSYEFEVIDGKAKIIK